MLFRSVYNNPVLLSDFKKVSVSLRASRFSLLPDEMFEAGPEFAEAVAEASFIDDDAEQLCPLEVAVKGSDVLVAIPYTELNSMTLDSILEQGKFFD